MQVTLLALAAFLTASVNGACPPKHTRSAPPPAATSIPSYSAALLPTTFSTTTTPTPTPTPDVIPEAVPVDVNVAVASPSTSSAAEPTPAAPAYDASLTADQSSALSAHNAARADVGVSALVWDAALASDAQAWADSLGAQSPAGTLVHDQAAGQGENLYWSSQSSDPYAEASTAWINEKSLYGGQPISTGGDFTDWGHYTQIIWGTTTHVGMAIADDGQGGVYVVARYSPPGNMIGETPTTAS